MGERSEESDKKEEEGWWGIVGAGVEIGRGGDGGFMNDWFLECEVRRCKGVI